MGVKAGQTGKLKIGDDWNAITIIALSQSNPLKAVAEFVENSIDARARHITITRGRQKGEHYLKITDDGEGVPRDRSGAPNFKYVATHICDSIKRKLREQGTQGLQGEFGIGLLSFWTVGEQLRLVSSGSDGSIYQMLMEKGNPDYRVRRSRRLFTIPGTELTIQPLLPGIRSFSGEKIQWYLASELRDRIRRSGVRISVVDRTARKEFRVEPRKFSGDLQRRLPDPSCPLGDVYVELYLADAQESAGVSLYRSGTRVLERINRLERFQGSPWNCDRLEGLIDAPFLTLTPGTRSGIVQDEAYRELEKCLEPLEASLNDLIEERRRAEDEEASRDILKKIRSAFREAMLALPAEEYDWFNVKTLSQDSSARSAPDGIPLSDRSARPEPPVNEEGEVVENEEPQKQFFEFPGPLSSVQMSPASCVVRVGQTRNLRAIARDRSRRLVEEGLEFRWEILEGDGQLENRDGEIVTFHADDTPGLTRLRLTASQYAMICRAEGLITITDSLVPEPDSSVTRRRGLPGYTFERAPGELWRSRFDSAPNVLVINSGHRDFVFASRTKALKLRYIIRLFAKEVVLANFPGQSPDQLLERLIELSLYTESKLR